MNKKSPLKWLFAVGVVGIALTAIAAYSQTPMRSVKAFTITCAVTPTLITNADGGYRSVRCANTSATEIFVGGSAVVIASGYPICSGSSCIDGALTMDSSMVNYCTVAAGTETLRCIAGK
jgi:hypothetical protein